MDSKTTIIEIERCFGIEDPNKIIGEIVAKKIKSIKKKRMKWRRHLHVSCHLKVKICLDIIALLW